MGKTKKHEKKSKKKHKHKEHKYKEKKKKCKKLKKEKQSKDHKILENTTATVTVATDGFKPSAAEDNFDIPLKLMNSKSHAPETPEEYQRRQEQIRRMTDPVTGRIRLIKGDGEVLEEIVSKERHADINKSATVGDGRFFQEQTLGNKRKHM